MAMMWRQPDGCAIVGLNCVIRQIMSGKNVKAGAQIKWKRPLVVPCVRMQPNPTRGNFGPVRAQRGIEQIGSQALPQEDGQ